MHGQQYKTYLGWKKIGRQVRKGEHGEKDHLGETVFGLDQTDEIRSRRRIEQDDDYVAGMFRRSYAASHRDIDDLDMHEYDISDTY